MPTKGDKLVTVMEVISAISQTARRGALPSILLDQVGREICQHIKAECFAVGLLDANSKILRFEVYHEGKRQLPPLSLPQEAGWGLAGRVFSEQASLLLQDLEQQDLPPQGLPGWPEPRSWVGVPIMIEKAPVGVLVAQSSEARGLSIDDQYLLESVAGLTVLALESDRLRQDLARQAEEMKAFVDVTRLLAASMEPEDTWKAILTAVGHLAPYETVEVGLYDETHNTVHPLLVGTAQEIQPSTEPDYHAGEGFTGWIIQNRRPLLVPNVHQERLFGEIRIQAQEQATLNELGQALTARLSVEQVLDESYRQAARLIDTTNFYVALYNPDEDEITFAIDVVKGDIRKPYTSRKAGNGLTEYIIHSRASLLIEENIGRRLQELGIEAIGPQADSWLGVPLMTGGRVLGVMAVQSYSTPRLYNKHDRDLLAAIASQAAIAIENARLFEETQQILEQVSQANEQQRQLLDVIRQMSTPLVPITEDILVLPLVGTIDSPRAQRIMEVTLSGVSASHARIVIIDITGVPVVDVSVANYLLQTTHALRMLGAEGILVGIRPEVAQTLVGLGIDLRNLTARNDLRGGVEYALKRLNKSLN